MSRGGAGVWSLRSTETVRLIVVALLAAGAVVVGAKLLGGGGGSGGSRHSSLRVGGGASGGVDPSSGPGGSRGRTSSSQADHVVVAAGPAVQRALSHGDLNVVVDVPPSGLFAEQNRSIAQGAAVAIDELNGAGGLPGHVQIKLMSQSLDGLSAAAVQARLGSEGAGVLILPCDTESQASLSAGASHWGMLMLAPCSPEPSVGSRYATYWSVGMDASEEAEGLASYMKAVGYGSVFVAGSQGNHYLEALTNAFRSAAQAAGIQVAGSASIATTTKDYSGLASAIKATSPPPAAIYTPLPPPLVNSFAAALLASGIDQTVIGGTAMDTPLTLSSGSKQLENAAFASYGFPRETKAAHRFAGEYASRFGRLPEGSFPALGFETVRLLEDAARNARSAEPSAIERALLAGLTLHGVGLADRAYAPNGNHDPVGEVAISKVSAGSFVPLLATSPKGSPTS